MEVALARQISDELRTPGVGGELPDSMLGPVSKWMDELSIYPDELFTIMAQRAAGSIGRGLCDGLRAVGQDRGEIVLRRDDHADAIGARLAGGDHGPGDHRTPADLVQDLGHGRAHPRALPSGHDQGRDGRPLRRR